MKVLSYVFITGLILVSLLTGTGQTNPVKESPEPKMETKVMVYYFHFTRRCATCNAVEDVARKTVIENYGSDVDFESCNLDLDEGQLKGEELNISVQALLIVRDDVQVNLTNEAFLNARSHPEKLTKLIQKEIDALL